MPKLLIFVGLMLMLGCHSTPQLPKPSSNDNVNAIVRAIADDEHHYFKYPFPLSIDLKKLEVGSYPEPDSNLAHGLKPVKWILHVESHHEFNLEDSLYILAQNDTLKKFKLKKRFFADIRLTTTAQQKLPHSRRYKPFYEITVPIFSADHNKAYVEMDVFYAKGILFIWRKRMVNGK